MTRPRGLPQRWSFDPEVPSDETAALAASEQIARAFDAWQAEHGQPQSEGLVEQLLHLKWGHLDGDFARWTARDLEEILLELFPRKVMWPAEDLADVVPATRAFVSFLDEIDVLRGEPVARLHAALDRIESELPGAMRDTSRFGMAKRLMGGIGADVDLGDPAVLQAAMDEFNARSFEERAELIGGPPRQAMPAVELPDLHELAATSRATPVFVQVEQLLDYIGDGRPLTTNGNLKLADGRELVTRLGTDDQFDEQIGDRVFKTSTTTELVQVDLVFRLALKARLARRYRGKVLVTTRGRQAGRRPLQAWSGLVEAMVDLGLCTLGREWRYRSFDVEELDHEAVPLLTAVAVGDGPVEVSELAERFLAVLATQFDLSSLSESARDRLRRGAPRSISGVADRWEWLGVLRRTGATERIEYRRTFREGGAVELTALGWWFLGPTLQDMGIDVPLLGPLADEDAPGLLERVGQRDEEAARADLRSWADGRSDPIGELIDVIADPHAGELRRVAVAVLDALGEPAVDRMLSLRDDPDLAVWVDVFLLDRGTPPEQVFGDDHSPEDLLLVLAATLVSAGPELVGQAVSSAPDAGRQARDVEVLWRFDHPHTDAVLEAIVAHADKPIAKAARKALFKRHSARM